jgi:hypothetical protein
MTEERKPREKTYNNILLNQCIQAREVTFIRNHVTNAYYIVLCQCDKPDFGGLAGVIDFKWPDECQDQYTYPARVEDSTTLPKEAVFSIDLG